MKKNLTELVFILDRSGSMHGLEKDTVEGFNAMIERQHEAEGEAVVTTVLFDDRYEILHDRENIKEIMPMTERQYFVRGCTALLDALGNTIVKVENTRKFQSEKDRAEKIIFVVTTDGYENASREYSHQMVSRMVEERKKEGWEFIFMGAYMDAVKEAARMGIDEERAVTFKNDSRGVRLNYSVMADTVAAMRANPSEHMDGSWKKSIEMDCIQRRE